MPERMPQLIVKYPNQQIQHYNLNKIRITIGRSTRNDICTPDPFASRVHAEIRREVDNYVLRDMGSANGTFYNGKKIDSEINLLNGDAIRIGETTLDFKDEAEVNPQNQTLIEDGGRSQTVLISLPAHEHQTTSGLLKTLEAVKVSGHISDAAIPDERGDLLALISKVGVTLLAPATLDETLQQVVTLVFEAVPAERCLILMRDDASGELRERVATLRREMGSEIGSEMGSERTANDNDQTLVGEFRISRAVVIEVIENGRSVMTSGVQEDPRFGSSTIRLQGIRAVLAVPLSVNDKTLGMIYADSPLTSASFTEAHLKVLTTLASVAAIRIENARLVEERLEGVRLERELMLACEIQQRLQPSAPPHIEGYEMVGISFPCYEIGGDYYDFIRLDTNKTLIALGDVSGKGTSAALLMSSLHAAMHAQVSSCASMCEAIGAVNRYLTKNTPSNRFVTLFSAQLDHASGSFAYINAGHNPPFIARAATGAIEVLEASGIPLGLVPETVFNESHAQLQCGDVLVIYSDGVSETNDPTGKE
ncbi:MAG: SpoIIE family protein phosphatase, partial [Pyrinomonadaceae bacterium]